MTDTPDLSLAAHDLNFHLHGTELAAALARADAAEALMTEVTRLLAAEVIRLRAECFALAAGACGGHYGDDYGHSRCSLVDAQRTRAEAAEALTTELTTEVIQLRADNEWLRWRIVALSGANNAARAALEDEA